MGMIIDLNDYEQFDVVRILLQNEETAPLIRSKMDRHSQYRHQFPSIGLVLHSESNKTPCEVIEFYERYDITHSPISVALANPHLNHFLPELIQNGCELKWPRDINIAIDKGASPEALLLLLETLNSPYKGYFQRANNSNASPDIFDVLSHYFPNQD